MWRNRTENGFHWMNGSYQLAMEFEMYPSGLMIFIILGTRECESSLETRITIFTLLGVSKVVTTFRTENGFHWMNGSYQLAMEFEMYPSGLMPSDPESYHDRHCLDLNPRT